MKCISVLKCAVPALVVAPFLAAVTAQRLKVETTDSVEVVVEIYFAERLPRLMFLSHKDPHYLVVGFEAFEVGEGIVFPSEGGGFLTELSMKKQEKMVLFRARSEQRFKHKVWYSNDEKRYRIVLTAEAPASPAHRVASDGARKEPSAAKKHLTIEAPVSATADRFELERVIFEETGVVLGFRGRLPSEFHQKALPLEAEALQIYFPNVTVEPVGDLAGRNEDLRCYREARGTSCTVFLKRAPEVSRNMTLRMMATGTGPEPPAPPAEPALEKAVPVMPETEPPALQDETRQGKSAETLSEESAQAEAIVKTAGGETVEARETGEEAKPAEAAPQGPALQAPAADAEESEANKVEESAAGVSEAKEPEMPLHPETSIAVAEPAKPPQEDAATQKRETPPSERSSKVESQPAQSEGFSDSPTGNPGAPPASQPLPHNDKVRQQIKTAPGLENLWTATLQGDLKEITYERFPAQSIVKLTFTKGPDFVARARVSEVLITALNVASDLFTREFAEGPVSRIDISPDLSGVQIVIGVRDGYEAQLMATGKDLVLRLTEGSSGAGLATVVK